MAVFDSGKYLKITGMAGSIRYRQHFNAVTNVGLPSSNAFLIDGRSSGGNAYAEVSSGGSFVGKQGFLRDGVGTVIDPVLAGTFLAGNDYQFDCFNTGGVDISMFASLAGAGPYDFDCSYVEVRASDDSTVLHRFDFATPTSDTIVDSVGSATLTLFGFTFGPTITSIGGDDVIFDGETSVATPGADFLAFAAGSKLELTNDAGTVVVDQLLTSDDWADTLITIPTIIRGGLKYTNDNKVKVTDSAAATGELVFTLSPPTGYNAVDVVSPVSDTTSVFFGASPAVATGDQAKVPDLTDEGGTLVLAADGTFTITGGGNSHTFELEVWDATDSTWSNTVVQTVNGSVSTQMVKSMVSNMISEMVK